MNGTHVKACANNRKYVNEIVQAEVKWLTNELEAAVAESREQHGKKF